MRMIGEKLTRDQFAELDAQTIGMLVTAVESDFATSAGRLANAIDIGDEESARRGRHALLGLCSAFGAAALRQASTGALGHADHRDALLAISQTTIAAIRDAATGSHLASSHFGKARVANCKNQRAIRIVST